MKNLMMNFQRMRNRKMNQKSCSWKLIRMILRYMICLVSCKKRILMNMIRHLSFSLTGPNSCPGCCKKNLICFEQVNMRKSFCRYLMDFGYSAE
jgi:hypothetical protein